MMGKMSEDQYPTLYRSADAASLKAQRSYLLLNRVYLGSLMLGAMTSVLTTMKAYLYTVLAVVLVVGLLVLWLIHAKQDDRVWFDGRAVAESVKTITWRFIMKVQPFHEDRDAEIIFVDSIRGIRRARPNLGKHLAGEVSTSGSVITSFMREKRSFSLGERRDFYVQARIHDQITWYANKAKSNSDAGTKCFWATVVLQVVTVVLAIVQAVSRGLTINPIPIVTTCASVIAAWSQMKRHDELAQSYTLAAQELEDMRVIAANQTSEDAFTQLVEQVENSISREHTLWCARRDTPPAGVAGINPGMWGVGA